MTQAQAIAYLRASRAAKTAAEKLALAKAYIAAGG